jgi:hypothetical protein
MISWIESSNSPSLSCRTSTGSEFSIPATNKRSPFSTSLAFLSNSAALDAHVTILTNAPFASSNTSQPFRGLASTSPIQSSFVLIVIDQNSWCGLSRVFLPFARRGWKCRLPRFGVRCSSALDPWFKALFLAPSRVLLLVLLICGLPLGAVLLPNRSVA